MLNLPLIKRQLLRTLRGPQKGLLEASTHAWELCPAETEITLPAIFFPEQLQRISGTQEHTNLDNEMSRIRGGVQLHGPTIAYRLHDVSLRQGTLYFGHNKLQIGKGPERIFAKGIPVEIPFASMASSHPGARYFGHWMTDDLTLRLAAKETGNPVSILSPRTAHQLDYAALFGVQVPSVSAAHFDELVVLEDFSQNSYKRGRYHALRVQARDTAHAVEHAGQRKSGHSVMLLRGQSGTSRLLTNETAIAERLALRGFTILDTSAMPAAEIIETISGARLVIGVEGSQLSHAIYAIGERSALIALQPPFRFNNVFKGYADCIGFRYGFIVGEENESGFRVSLDEIERMLDHVDRILA